MARVLFAQQNTVKTANQNSRINFYFVTSFYHLYDICIVRHEAFIQIRIKQQRLYIGYAEKKFSTDLM